MFTETQNESTIIYCSHQMEEVERVADNLIIMEKGSVTNNSSPDDFVERIASWVVDFSDKKIDTTKINSALSCKKIDGLHHIVTLDQDQNFSELLENLGGTDIQKMGINLPNAVNAFLAHKHNAPTSNVH
jgi:ABC-2 type transport system ATP-binding protein